jgi:hypothetical protein
VLLIFDLVIGRTAGLVMAGITLLLVIIIGALPAILRGNHREHPPSGSYAREEEREEEEEGAWL